MGSTGTRQLCRCVLSFNNKRALSRRRCLDFSRHRQFSVSTRRLAPGEEGDDEEVDREEPKSVWPKKDPRTGGFHPDVLGIEHRERWDRASMAEREEIKTAWTQEKQELELSSKEAPIEEMMNSLARDPELRDAEISVDDSRITKSQTGWFAEEEDDDFALTPDHEEGNDSDMTSVAHDELALQREIREYARLAAWDMPLLKKFQKEEPNHQTLAPLRFRYTTYLGESHPADRKVVVEFSPSHKDLKLTTEQQLKLKKLAGTRFNPYSKQIKISCEQFETPAQNKRYLADLVNKLLTAAKDATDTFADIPLDLRHHKPHKTLQFPQEWILGGTGEPATERDVKAYKTYEANAVRLAKERKESRSEKESRTYEAGGDEIDGAKLVAEHITKETAPPESARQPQMVPAGYGAPARSRAPGMYPPPS